MTMAKFNMRRLYRYITAILFVISAIGKIVYPNPSAKLIGLFFAHENAEVLVYYIAFIYALAVYEIILALMLIFLNKQITIIICAVTFVIFIVVLISYPIRNIEIKNCGCYGSLLPESNVWYAMLKNIVFLVWAVIALKSEGKNIKLSECPIISKNVIP